MLRLSFHLINFYEFVNLGIVQPRCVCLMELINFFPTPAFPVFKVVLIGYFSHFIQYILPFTSRVIGRLVQIVFNRLFVMFWLIVEFGSWIGVRLQILLDFLDYFRFYSTTHQKMNSYYNMDKYNKQNLKARAQLTSDRQNLFNPVSQQETQEQRILNTVPDNQVQSKLKILEQNTKKEKQQTDQKQQETTLKYAGQKLQNIQRKLQATINESQSNPEQVVEDVKKELNQLNDPVSKYNAPINIQGQLVPRQQFREFLENYLVEYPYIEKGKQLFNKYAIFSKNRKPLTSAEMELNASILLDKLRKYQSAREDIDYLLHRIQNEIYYLTQKPHQWFKWFLKKKGLNKNPVLYNKALVDQNLQMQEAKSRLQELINKKNRIHTEIDNYVRKANRLRNNNIRQYAKMMQAKDQLHTTQKSVLTFLIDQKGSQINNLHSQIQKEQNEFNTYKSQVNTKVTQWQKQRQNKEDQLLKQIDEIKSYAKHQQQVIKQKSIQQKKLKQELTLKKSQQHKNLQMLQDKVNLHNQTIQKQLERKSNQLSKKNAEQERIIKQLDEKNQNQKVMLQQQQIMIQQLQKRDQMLSQKSQYENQLIRYQQSILEQYKRSEIKLQQKLQEQTNMRRKQAQLLSQIENQKNISLKNAEIARLREIQKKNVDNINSQLKQRQQKLAVFNQQALTHIKQLQSEIQKHRQDLKTSNQNYEAEISTLKRKMLETSASQTQTIKDRQELILQSRSQYQKLQKMLEGRQAEYQKHIKSLSDKLQQQISQKEELLKGMTIVTKENQKLHSQLTTELQRLKKNASDNILSARAMAQDKGKALIKQQQENQALKSSLQILEKNEAKRQQISQQRIIQYQKKISKEIEKLEKQKLQLEQKLSKMNIELNLSKQRLKQLQSVPQNFQLSFKYWWNQKTKLYTIRQCFRSTQKDKWIASTRGINFTDQQKKQIEKTLASWNSQKKPKLTKRLLNGTQIIQIIDEYKGKIFYSLRQIYYYNGIAQPTRRGFNIAQDDLDSFFKGIQKMLGISEVQN